MARFSMGGEAAGGIGRAATANLLCRGKVVKWDIFAKYLPGISQYAHNRDLPDRARRSKVQASPSVEVARDGLICRGETP